MKTTIAILIAVLSPLALAQDTTNKQILEQLQVLNGRIEALEKKIDQRPTPSTIAFQDPDKKIFGMFLTRGPKGNRVSKVFADSPADKAGVRTGDLILEVDGENVTGLSSIELQSRFEKKDSYQFTLQPRHGDTKKLEILKKRQGDFSVEGGGFRLVDGGRSIAELEIGDIAPDLTALTQDGKSVRLQELQDKVVLLNFTATWCQPCKSELPILIGLYNDYKQRGFEIISVFLDTSSSDVAKYVKDNSIPWPVLAGDRGWDTTIAREYGVSSVPANPLIVNGRIAEDTVRGHAAEEILKRYIKK